MRVGLPRPAGRDRDLDDRRDPGFLAGVDAVIDQFLDDDPRPLVSLVAGLRDQLLLGAKFHQARRGERHALDLVRRLVRLCFGRPDTMRRGFRPNRARATLTAPTLQPKAAAIDGGLLAALPHLLQLLPAIGRPAHACDLTSANFVKISDLGGDFSKLKQFGTVADTASGTALANRSDSSVMTRHLPTEARALLQGAL